MVPPFIITINLIIYIKSLVFKRFFHFKHLAHGQCFPDKDFIADGTAHQLYFELASPVCQFGFRR